MHDIILAIIAFTVVAAKDSSVAVAIISTSGLIITTGITATGLIIVNKHIKKVAQNSEVAVTAVAQTNVKVDEYHEAVNSKMDKLLDLTDKAAFAKGQKHEKEKRGGGPSKAAASAKKPK